MAIARGAGTEIIRSVLLKDVDDTWRTAIYGVRHHIYTILNINIFAYNVNTAGNYCEVKIVGYDAVAGTSGQDFFIVRQDMQNNGTFVWNDKFSFNGYEPVDFTGPLDSEAKQDAIADQAVSSDTRQSLQVHGEHGSDHFMVAVTYIDQNNA